MRSPTSRVFLLIFERIIRCDSEAQEQFDYGWQRKTKNALPWACRPADYPHIERPVKISFDIVVYMEKTHILEDELAQARERGKTFLVLAMPPEAPRSAGS